MASHDFASRWISEYKSRLRDDVADLDIGIVAMYQPAGLHVDSNQLAGLLIPHRQFTTHGGYLYLSLHGRLDC